MHSIVGNWTRYEFKGQFKRAIYGLLTNDLQNRNKRNLGKKNLYDKNNLIKWNNFSKFRRKMAKKEMK